MAHLTAYMDDRTGTARCDHLVGGGCGKEIGCPKVNIHDGVEILGRGVERRPVAGHAGRIDHDVKRPKTGKRRAGRIHIGDVELLRLAAQALGLHRRMQLAQRPGTARGADDMRPRPGQGRRGPQTDARCGTGHKRAFPRKVKPGKGRKLHQDLLG